MNRASTAATPVTTAAEPTSDLQEKIRCRAYELYEQRGREGGHELGDWLQAESEVVQSKERATAA